LREKEGRYDRLVYHIIIYKMSIMDRHNVYHPKHTPGVERGAEWIPGTAAWDMMIGT
jgi:hypothetical protein